MILKVALVGICVCILCSLLKNRFGEAVLPLEIAFAVVVLLWAGEKMKVLTDDLLSFLSETEAGSAAFSAIIKGALVCVITKLSCDIAKDSGNTLVSDIIDLTGRLMLVTICFPFFESVIKTAVSFLP